MFCKFKNSIFKLKKTYYVIKIEGYIIKEYLSNKDEASPFFKY